ncbi:nucleolar complex protein 2 homolog isoform X2 [Telopea speciosissima]|uniref:nucleolar complex protein 2 homolog isoform X2 n=1 Tax=Telopea speciosissima TaxID=54955 RepID=UPI001CC4911D|nr:nucleolar complex protein 2 homolog isoform X2 [Telopea speciosissima]
MGKLGKKARKFAKKNLQSVLKRKRKTNSMFKRKKSSRDKGDTSDENFGSITDLSNGRNSDGEAFGYATLDVIFSEYASDTMEDASDSDGFFSEDASCPYFAESEHENDSEDVGGHSALLGHNKEIHLELAKQKKKLDILKKKDPEFAKFLESYNEDLEQFSSEASDSDVEGEKSDQGNQEAGEDCSNLSDGKVFTSSTIDIWSQLVMEQNNTSALPNLLNGYRTACHYGTDNMDSELSWRIQKSNTFCKILMFMLCEADGIFRRLLGISSANSKKENILELKNNSKWKIAKPLIKSYLRSTLFLLNQVTNSEILGFVITRLRASIIFFPAFPSLLRRLIKVSVHLWATGGGTLSQSSFLILRDVALLQCSDCFDTCLVKAYKAFIAHCKFVEPANLQHIQFLGDSLVKLCSADVQKSFSWAMVTVQQLAKIMQHSFKTKRKEALKKLSNWQYINCIDLWVKFISSNIRDHDIQPLLYLIIQVISGVAHLFPGPRYLPLRLKCVQMLNHLSISSGVFIPVSSLLLDSLEYGRTGKVDVRHGKAFSFSSILKVPKQWFKSLKFQEVCILSAIELLSAHFAQWSYHISFPELATIPLIRLRKFHEKTIGESLRRPVKRLMDQVEQNVEYVQKKRNEVAFSPKDEELVQSFLQLEKCSGNTPFTQYYTSIMRKSFPRHGLEEKISVQNQKTSRKKPAQPLEHVMDVSDNGEVLKNENVNSITNGRMNGRKKKQRT